MTEAEAASTPLLKRVPLWAKILAPAALILVVIVIITLAALRPSTFTAHGTISVINTEAADNPCSIAGYSDIAEGASVTVTDSSNKTIALGQLGPGKADSDALECVYSFTVNDVPSGEKFYGIEITRRGNVKVSEKEMHQGVGLTLG